MSFQRLLKRIARPFITGIIALLPVVLTVAIIAWVASFLADLIGPGSVIGSILKQFGWNIGSTDTGAYLGGVLATIVLIYLFGLMVESGLKGRWERFSTGILSRVPVIRTVYDAAKKIVRMVEPQGNAEMKSMTPVMCSFGGPGGTSFPAFLPTTETILIQGTEYKVVMIPTAPVPFGGAIMCVPKDWISPLDCGIDGLLNIYMSMGTAMPDYLGPDDSK